jgi:hypothetical protein
MRRGVVYNATGADYVVEAHASAASLRAVHQELPAALFTDHATAGEGFDVVLPFATQENHFCHRIETLRRSPYDDTLAIDSDTYCCGPILDLFSLLDRFDLAFAAAPTRLSNVQSPLLSSYMQRIPLTFPQPNAGLLLYRQTQRTLDLWDAWESFYRRDLALAASSGFAGIRRFGICDQPSLREALFRSDLRWTVLPPEYNCILSIPGQLHGAVRILHARHPDPARVAELLNRDLGRRVFALNRVKDLTVIGMDGRVRRHPTLPRRQRLRLQIRRWRGRLSRWWRA